MDELQPVLLMLNLNLEHVLAFPLRRPLIWQSGELFGVQTRKLSGRIDETIL